MPILKPIPIENIPEAGKLGAKESAVPEILKQCIKGQALPITNTYTEVKTGVWKSEDKPKIATIRSFITKQHKKGHYTNIKMEQRLERKDGKKIITLYVIKV